MDGNWLESGDELEARERAEKEARRADEDLSAVASMPEGLRFLSRLLARWGAEGPVDGSAGGLALRGEAESLLSDLARVAPKACLRLMAEARGIIF